jgi:hypothetical protein
LGQQCIPPLNQYSGLSLLMDEVIPSKRIITGIDVDIEKGRFCEFQDLLPNIRLCPYLQRVSDSLQCPNNRHHR